MSLRQKKVEEVVAEAADTEADDDADKADTTEPKRRRK